MILRSGWSRCPLIFPLLIRRRTSIYYLDQPFIGARVIYMIRAAEPAVRPAHYSASTVHL
jgi:hypothetical protein